MRAPLPPIVALACLLSAGAARAELNLYLQIQGGPSFAQDADVSDRHGPVNGTFRFDHGDDIADLGWNAGGAIGLQLNRRSHHSFRFELAGGVNQSDVKQLRGDDTVLARGGELQLSTGLFNGYYEHYFGNLAWFKAFIGGGLGVGFVDFSGGDASSLVLVDGDSLEFAWNATAGVVLPLSDHFELIGAYRYLSTTDATIDATRRDPGTGAVISRGNVDVEVGLHDLLFGLRFTF